MLLAKAASPWSAGSGSNPPATPRLPPLEGEATARLVQGLKKLQDSAERFAPCLSARPLRSISYLGQVANSRLHEADVELGAHESQVYANLKKPPADLRVRAVADPLSSPTADGARLRPVKQDDMVLETLKMQEMRYYKVAVPSRPVVVTVTAAEGVRQVASTAWSQREQTTQVCRVWQWGLPLPSALDQERGGSTASTTAGAAPAVLALYLLFAVRGGF
ncbi:unnamed protein product [Effrenium voratum]|nr:unnamed protein product [Effrenium voratum]